MKRGLLILAGSILLAVAVMLLASRPLGQFIDRNPSIKMLARQVKERLTDAESTTAVVALEGGRRGWFLGDGTGYLAQRSMACRSERDARAAAVLFAWLQVFLRSLLWLAIALGLLVLYPFRPEEAAGEGFAAAREMLFVHGIDDLLPPGARGLMLVGLLAALASTVDTHLNWGASYWSKDVYEDVLCRRLLGRQPKPRELVLVARLSNVLILAIAMAVMVNLGSIQTAWFVSLLFGAGMGSVLVLRWLWERINLYSELAAMAASLVTAPLLLYFLGTDPEDEWIRLGIMALVTTTVRTSGCSKRMRLIASFSSMSTPRS